MRRRLTAVIVSQALLLVFLFAGEIHAGSRIVFEEEVFDFGVLIQGATAQHTFQFKNTGDDVLELQSITTTCGCTAALPSDKLIPSGEKSEIWVGYDSKGKMGQIRKIVRVKTNDSGNPMVQLVVQGLVVPVEHPPMSGLENIFESSCAACHVDPGRGKKGEVLYRSDCAMCHEHHKMGGRFIASSAEEMSHRSRKEVRRAIAEGRPGTSMPAFLSRRGGPLTGGDIRSIVRYIFKHKERD